MQELDDQNKSKIAHKFWLPILKQLLQFINQISDNQISDNQLFKNILTYSCLYSIFKSKVAFPKTRLLPVFLDTAITENWKIRKYLKTFDQNLNIYQFKEQEEVN